MDFNKILIKVYDSQYILEKSDAIKPSLMQMFSSHKVLFFKVILQNQRKKSNFPRKCFRKPS